MRGGRPGRGDARRAPELSSGFRLGAKTGSPEGLIRRLVLWDVDGTLIDSAGLGRAAFEEAFELVTGAPPTVEVPFAGRTDLEIALDMLQASGMEAADRLLADFGKALERAMAERAEVLSVRGRALPGAGEALARLGREPGVVQSLLTGNIEPNAAIKLGAFGLERELDLPIGAYGSDHHHRGELVAIARRKAERKYGVEIGSRQVVVVGDTPLDIAAALEGRAGAVGVATGPYDASALARAGAHVVLDDLTDSDAVAAAVLSGQ